MMRFFNTAGPVKAEDHYCLPPLGRLDMEDILSLIQQKKYFVLHAPRQTGKTTCMLALMEYLNQLSEYRALYANIEGAQGMRENVSLGIATVVQAIGGSAKFYLGEAESEALAHSVSDSTAPGAALETFLTDWCATSSKPTVLFIDEIDSLIGDTLISVLRQIRSGYTKRPAGFPQSIILCGVRDVRDYRIHSSQDKAVITGGSAFNIKAESLRLGNFTQEDIAALYGQHTTETGQVFEPEVAPAVWDLTRGQPWLVNALAYEVCFKMKENRDRSRSITAEMIYVAKENLILRRETHLDQLGDKLQEDRVRRVILPVLTGEGNADSIPSDDIAYVRDLGLIRTEGQITIANAIYREVIPRELTYSTQLMIPLEPAWYILPNGRIDMRTLLTAFGEFFRENSEHWVERFDYKEAGPQLLLQAFLQRIINGGGRVEREYGLGRKRTDLLLLWPVAGEEKQKVVLELKIVHGSTERTIAEGLPQTADYMDRSGAKEGHLVVFDRDPQKPWGEKIFEREEMSSGFGITVWGM